MLSGELGCDKAAAPTPMHDPVAALTRRPVLPDCTGLVPMVAMDRKTRPHHAPFTTRLCLFLCRCYEADEGPPNCSLTLLRSDFVIEGGYQMDRTSCSAVSRHTLHCALELSKNSWLLAIQFPDREQPSVYSIEGGDTEKLMAKLTAARDCWAKVIGSLPVITLCYEVGYDAFWLARFLRDRVPCDRPRQCPGQPARAWGYRKIAGNLIARITPDRAFSHSLDP